MSEYREYLDRHLEPEKPVQPVPDSLLKPAKENIKFHDWGYDKLKWEKDGFISRVECGDPSEPPMEGKWKRLEKWTIRDKNGKSLLNLNSLLKPRLITDREYKDKEVNVIFPATNDTAYKGNINASSRIYEDKEGGYTSSIILYTNITSPKTLVALLHELGHFRLPEEGIGKAKEPLDRYRRYWNTLNKNFLTSEEKEDPEFVEKFFEIILEEERGAWAYTLNKMRPLIRAGFFKKEEVIDLVHNMALQSYSDDFRIISDPTFKQKILIAIKSFLATRLDVGDALEKDEANM